MANNDLYKNLWGLITFGSQQETDPTKQGIYKTIQDYMKDIWGKENPEVMTQLGEFALDPSKITDWGSLYDLAKGFSDNPAIYDPLIKILDQYAPANLRSTTPVTTTPELAIITPPEHHLRGQPAKGITPPEGIVAGEATATPPVEEAVTPPVEEVVTPPEAPSTAIDPFAGTSLAGLGLGLIFPELSQDEVDYLTQIVTESTSEDIEAQTKVIEYLITLYEKYKGEVSLTPEEILKRAQDMGAVNYDSIIQALDDTYKTKMTQLQNQKGEINAIYAGVYKEIQDGIRASRARTKEDLNSRGLMFSGLLSRALAGVEEEGLKLIGENAEQQAAKLISIANEIAVLTSNYTGDQLKTNSQKAVYVGLQYMSIMTDDKKEKQAIDLILVQLRGQLSTLDITKQSTIDKAVSDAIAGAEAGKISNWKDYMTISISYMSTMSNMLNDQRASDLADKKFDFSKDLALNQYALDQFIAENGTWQDRATIELGWANLTEEQRQAYVDEGIQERQQRLAEAQAAIESNPQDPTQMKAAEIANIMTKIAPTFINIYKKDAKGNVMIDKNTKQPIVLNTVMIFADEEQDQETGMPIITAGGLRDTYNIYKTALNAKSKNLANFVSMSPTDFNKYLISNPEPVDPKSFPSQEEQVAYAIAYKYGFDLSDGVSLLAYIKDLRDKYGEEYNWNVIYEMIFGGSNIGGH